MASNHEYWRNPAEAADSRLSRGGRSIFRFNARRSALALALSFTLILFIYMADMSTISGLVTTSKAISGLGISFYKSTDSFFTAAYPKKHEHALTCPTTNMTLTCPANYPSPAASSDHAHCPDYFRWIHEDLKPWKEKGISREMVEAAEKHAHFRLLIVNGTAYVRRYDVGAFQTWDVLTLWGFLQLLRLYPGRLPDLDLMFQCHDLPLIRKDDYQQAAQGPPPLFHYCGSDSTFDIAFPDMSFWGWPQLNINPWEHLLNDIQEGTERIMKWKDREPFAFWRGNLDTGVRRKLDKCNSIEDWGAAIYQQDWGRERAESFKNSDLSKQCTHRYKIYIEGNAWSASEKYILACDSVTLLVNPTFYEFFSRSLVPLKHYWPINADADRICSSIKYAVNWGNSYPDKAQEIGKAGSKFVRDQLTMDNVYDYMFHVLDQYAKLLTYKPTVPPGAVELCSDRWVCSPIGIETEQKIDSMVKGRSQRNPCTMPPPYDPQALEALLDQNDKIIKQVDTWAGSEGIQ